jgi:hypothetical protein
MQLRVVQQPWQEQRFRRFSLKIEEKFDNLGAYAAGLSVSALGMHGIYQFLV